MKCNIVNYLVVISAVLFLQSCEKNDDEFVVENRARFEAEVNNERIVLVESAIFSDTAIFSMPSRQIGNGEPDFKIDIWKLALGKNMTVDGSVTSRLTVNFVNHLEDRQYLDGYAISRKLFEKILSEGEKTFTPNDQDFPGVSIKWIDAEGNLWASGSPYSHEDSEPDTSAELENYFTINFSINQDEQVDLGTYSQYLDISFQCRLYNWKHESIDVKNARLQYTFSFF